MHTQRRQPAYRPTRVFDGPIDSGRFQTRERAGPDGGRGTGGRRKAQGERRVLQAR